MATAPAPVVTQQQVYQALPERSQLVTQGRSWEGGISTTLGTFFAAAGVPTTLCALALQNGEGRGSNIAYVIDRVSLFVITSAAAGGIGILTTGVLSPGRVMAGQTQQIANAVFAGTVATAASTKSWSGKGFYAGNATLYSVCTITAIPALAATDWVPMQSLSGAGGAATTLGSAVMAECYGRYIVPPGGAIAFNGVAANAAGSYGMWVSWHEVPMSLV